MHNISFKYTKNFFFRYFILGHSPARSKKIFWQDSTTKQQKKSYLQNNKSKHLMKSYKIRNNIEKNVLNFSNKKNNKGFILLKWKTI